MPAAADSLSEDSLARGAHSACTSVPPQPPPLRPLAERGQSCVQKGLEHGAICGHKVCCGWRRQEKPSSTVPWAGGVLNVFAVGTACQCEVAQARVSTWLDTITIKAATFIFRRRGPRAWR